MCTRAAKDLGMLEMTPTTGKPVNLSQLTDELTMLRDLMTLITLHSPSLAARPAARVAQSTRRVPRRPPPPAGPTPTPRGPPRRTAGCRSSPPPRCGRSASGAPISMLLPPQTYCCSQRTTSHVNVRPRNCLPTSTYKTSELYGRSPQGKQASAVI